MPVSDPTTLPDPPKGYRYVDCLCRGGIPMCRKCDGTGWQLKKNCPRCMGGLLVGKCPDCRNRGWLEDLNV